MADVALSTVTSLLTGLIQTAAPGALVIPREIMGIDTDEGLNLDLLRPTPGAAIRAWLFWAVTETMKRGETVAYPTEHARRARRYDKTWTFAVRHFYEYQTGSNATNNYLAAFAEREAVTDALALEPKLGSDNPNLRQHNDLQWPSLKTRFYGERLVHVAQGRIDVIVWKSIGP